jgi:uncharacterized protein (TIGR03435 family)
MMKARVGDNHRIAFLILSAWMLLCGTAAVAQQNSTAAGTPDAIGPAFEVAAIRPANSDGSGGFGIEVEPSGRFKAHAVSIDFLFRQAYQDASGKSAVTVDRGAPKWVGSDLFDINATVDEAYKDGWDKLSDEQRMDRVRPMIGRLLADRFHVKTQVEMRKTPVYVLVQGKGGAHVKEVPAPVPMEGDRDKAMARWIAEHPGKGAPGSIMCGGDGCIGNAVKMSVALGQIAVSSGADRMVIDETGLKGYYDFSFRFALPHDSEETPMQAVEDDLGIRFEPRSVPMKTYVIESAEKPSVDGA